MDIKRIVTLIVITSFLQMQGAAPVAAAVSVVGKQTAAELAAAKVKNDQSYSEYVRLSSQSKRVAIMRATPLEQNVAGLVVQYVAKSPWLVRQLECVKKLTEGRHFCQETARSHIRTSLDETLALSEPNRGNGLWFTQLATKDKRYLKLFQTWLYTYDSCRAPYEDIFAVTTQEGIVYLFDKNTKSLGKYTCYEHSQPLDFTTGLHYITGLDWSSDGCRLTTHTTEETFVFEPIGDLLPECQQELERLQKQYRDPTDDFWETERQEQAEKARAAAAGVVSTSTTTASSSSSNSSAVARRALQQTLLMRRMFE